MKRFILHTINIFLITISFFLVSCGAEDMWSRINESGTMLHITYNANGGTGSVPVDSTGYVPDDEAIVSGNINGMTNGTQVFTGWTLSSDGTGTLYTQGQIYTIGSQDIVLYARWVTASNPYSIVYDANGAEGGTIPVDTTMYINPGDIAILLDNTGGLYTTGLIFSGWNLVQNPLDSTTNYAPFNEYTINPADAVSYIITFYAQWNLPLMVSQDYTLGINIDNSFFAVSSAAVSAISNSVHIPQGESLNSRYFRIPAIIEGVATISEADSSGVNSFSVIRVPLPPAINKKNLPTGFYFNTDPGSENIITSITLLNEDGSTPSFPQITSYPDNTEYTYKIVLYNTYQQFWINGTLVRTTTYALKSTLWWTFQISGVNNISNDHLLDSISIRTIQQSDTSPVVP